MNAVVAGERLKRQLTRSADDAGVAITHVSEITKSWSSCSFVGGRHELTLSAPIAAPMRAWLDNLDANSFRVPSFVLADLVVSTVEIAGDLVVATIDALTIEEA